MAFSGSFNTSLAWPGNKIRGVGPCGLRILRQNSQHAFFRAGGVAGLERDFSEAQQRAFIDIFEIGFDAFRPEHFFESVARFFQIVQM